MQPTVQHVVITNVTSKPSESGYCLLIEHSSVFFAKRNTIVRWSLRYDLTTHTLLYNEAAIATHKVDVLMNCIQGVLSDLKHKKARLYCKNKEGC